MPAGLAKFDAKVVVADESPRVLEGDWPSDKGVILAFADEAEAQRFGASSESQAIAQARKAGADAVVIMAMAFSPTA